MSFPQSHEDDRQDILTLLADVNAEPLNKPGLMRALDSAGCSISAGRVERALLGLTEKGKILALNGEELAWSFYDKRPNGIYYVGKDVYEAHLKELEAAAAAKADERLREQAAKMADDSIRRTNIELWTELRDAFYKDLKAQEGNG